MSSKTAAPQSHDFQSSTNRPPFQQLRQTSLATAGVQPWSRRVISSDGKTSFAFASSSSVYLFDIQSFRLLKLIFAHEATITSIVCPAAFPGLLVTASADGSAAVWDTLQEKRVFQIFNTSASHGATASEIGERAITCIDVAPEENTLRIALASHLGVYEWMPSYGQRAHICSCGKSRPSMLQWNPSGRMSQLVIGRMDGKVELASQVDGKWRVSALRDNSMKPHLCGEVLDLRWDPLSLVYLLALHRNGTIFLWDMEQKSPSVRTKVSPKGVTGAASGGARSIAWMPWNPGSFLTVSSRSGVISVYNISSQEPISTHRITSGTGFNFLQRLSFGGKPIPERRGNRRDVDDPYTKESVQNLHRAAICSFVDGSVGIVDLEKMSLMWRSQSGHRETIFDARFCPKNCNILATSSYDNTVKIWNTRDLTVELTMQVDSTCNKGIKTNSLLRGDSLGSFFNPHTQGRPFTIVYSLSWESNGERLVLGLSSGRVQVWSLDVLSGPSYTENGKILRKPRAKLLSGNKDVPPLHKGSVFCVDWSPFHESYYGENDDYTGNKNSNLSHEQKKSGGLIASASGDRWLIISRPNGGVVCKERHPNTVFGCHWNRCRPGVLATACADGSVRVFHLNLSKSLNKVRLTRVECLRGHSSSTFRAIWSPHSPTLLASSSNDKSIRVWDLNKHSVSSSAHTSRSENRSLVAVLRGHSHHVRALLYHTEFPEILLSGGWDATIRVWNFNLDGGVCIGVIGCHSADVYGLDVHPHRPFTFVSSSRDATLRFWKMDSPAVIRLRVHAILGNRWQDIVESSAGTEDKQQEAALNRSRNRIFTGVRMPVPFKTKTRKVSKQPLQESAIVQSYTGAEGSTKENSGNFHLLKLAGRRSQEIMNTLQLERGFKYGRECGGRSIRDCENLKERLMDARHLRVIMDFFGMSEGGNFLWQSVQSAILDAYGPPDREPVDDNCIDEGFRTPFFKVMAQNAIQSRPMFSHRSLIVSAALQRVEWLLSSYGDAFKDSTIDRAVGLLCHVGKLRSACELLISGNTQHLANDEGYSNDRRHFNKQARGAHISRWNRALAMSPGVSLSYWEELRERRLQYLQSHDTVLEDNQGMGEIPSTKGTELGLAVDMNALLAGKRALYDLVCKLMQEGEFWNALLVVQAEGEGRFGRSGKGVDQGKTKRLRNLKREIAQSTASRCIELGNNVIAATCYVAIDDFPCYRATSTLMQADEIELAYCVGVALGHPDSEILPIARVLASRRLESCGNGAIEHDTVKLHSAEMSEKVWRYPDGGECLLDSSAHLELAVGLLQRHGLAEEQTVHSIQELCSRSFCDENISRADAKISYPGMAEALLRRGVKRKNLYQYASLRTTQQYLVASKRILDTLGSTTKLDGMISFSYGNDGTMSIEQFQQYKMAIRYQLLGGDYDSCAIHGINLLWHILNVQHSGNLFSILKKHETNRVVSEVYSSKGAFSVMHILESISLKALKKRPLIFARLHVLAFYFASQHAMMLGYVDLASYFFELRRKLLRRNDESMVRDPIEQISPKRPTEPKILLQEAQFLCVSGGSQDLSKKALSLLHQAERLYQAQPGLSVEMLQVIRGVDILKRSLVARGVVPLDFDGRNDPLVPSCGGAHNDESKSSISNEDQILARIRDTAKSYVVRREQNCIMVSGQMLPSGQHAKHGISDKISCITGRPISGPSVQLEDGKTMMSLSEAVMYVQCTRFSPLCTGYKLDWV